MVIAMFAIAAIVILSVFAPISNRS